MARTNSDLVEGIIEVDLASGALLDPFISVANALVTQCCTNLTTEYTDTYLVEIETWLAAHFYTVRDMRAESEKAGPVSEKKQSKVDLGLATSHYGQHAMLLDYQGGLARLNRRIKKGMRVPSLSWLGKEEDEL